MLTAHPATFIDGVVVVVPAEDLLELHGALIQADGRSEVADRLLSILETAISGAPLARFAHHSVHVDQLPLA